MTRRRIMPVAALAAVLLAAVLALAGCDYLLDSPFPAYVPLMTEGANVADEMPWEQGAHYELRVIGSPTGDYVWIYGEGSSFRERFALYDTDLHLVLEGEESGDTFWGEGPLIFNGSGFYIGKRFYNTSFVRQAGLDATWGPGSGYYDGTGEYAFARSSGAAIQWEAWSGPTSGHSGGNAVSVDGINSYDVEGLTHDVGGGRVALYARAMGTNMVVGFVGAAGSFRSNFGATVIGTPGAFTIFASSSDFDRPMFAGDGTVIRYHDDERLVFYDLKGIKGADLSMRDSGDTRIGFSPQGGHWYVFEPKLGRITKARTWW